MTTTQLFENKTSTLSSSRDGKGAPRIITDLPGPKAQALLARDAQVVSPSYPRDYPFVMDYGRGAEVWDVDGNRFIDFAAGIAVTSTGHAHPEVVEAIKSAADKFLHISSDYYHELQIRLGEKMSEIAPFDEPALTFFINSGTESVEGALKLARLVSHNSTFTPVANASASLLPVTPKSAISSWVRVLMLCGVSLTSSARPVAPFETRFSSTRCR